MHGSKAGLNRNWSAGYRYESEPGHVGDTRTGIGEGRLGRSLALRGPNVVVVKFKAGIIAVVGLPFSRKRGFDKGYGMIARPLSDLLKEGFSWNEETKTARNQLKFLMSTIPILALPNFSQPFILETDASPKALGSVLVQQERPIAFLSQAVLRIKDYQSMRKNRCP
ncbi:hypothetical protein ACH5RR_032212 [Cinchona calisaya]|uniref:Reverse transcriptase/retrotransposon-derived protein RNase H-like domain-containing protein n=1 Tax=Cinchona calisaya TaxID=153742 RepID=A0ABD2YLP5_9GENT